MADPDLELRGEGGWVGSLDFLAPLAFVPSVISSFFTQNKGGGLSPRSATGMSAIFEARRLLQTLSSGLAWGGFRSGKGWLNHPRMLEIPFLWTSILNLSRGGCRQTF